MKRVIPLTDFIFKLKQFMTGRNGPDKMTYGLLVIYCIFSVVKIFLRQSYWGYIIASVLQYSILAYAVFRILSRNLEKRYQENLSFQRMTAWLDPYIEHLKLRIQFFSTHRFRKCKHCGNFLRLKKSKGKREVKCPKCGKLLKFRFFI